MKKIMKGLVLVASLAVMMFAMSFAVLAVDTITPTKSVTGSEKSATKTYTFTQNDKFPGQKSDQGLVIPVNISEPGALELNINVVRLDKNMTVEIYTDAQCTNRITGFFKYLTVGEVNAKGYVALSNKGTYYIRLESSVYDDSVYTNTVNISTRLYLRGERNIKSGQTITYYRNSGSDEYLFKYKAEKTGKVTVSFSYEHGSYLTLLNSKKKALSDEEWVLSGYNFNKFTFAVKKGVTYYFKVKSNGTSGNTAAGNGNLHTINVKNTAVKAKAGSSRKKAVTIKYNKTAKGLITAGDKSAKWYKIALKKGKKPAFILQGNLTGSVKIQIINKSGKVISSSTWSGSKSRYNSWGNWKKGTYYIKVSRANSLSSGYFTIKNKQAKK